jgi:serine phosphatase RsbU (regulator of sigma subunit)
VIVSPVLRGGTGRLDALAGDAASEERYRTLFQTMPLGIVHYDADRSIIGVNPAAGEILGLDLATVTLWPVVPQERAVREDGSPFPVEDLPVPVALRTGEIVAGVVVGIRHGRTGELRWVQITAVPDARDDEGRPSRAYAILTDLTEQRRAERERAELLASTRAARAEADNARERLAFLMRAGALVAATRDRNELLDQIVKLVVPLLADCCVLFLPTTEGTLLASALGHTDSAQAVQLAGLRARPIAPDGPLLSQRAYASGTTQLSRDATAEMPAWAGAEPDAMGIVKLMRPRSAISTPLLAGPDPLGVIALYRGAGRPPFTETDVSVVEELGRRLAVGLANTDTFAREHDIAETLQRSLLPDALPQIPGLDLAVRYLPATEGTAVGGDWYDAFPLTDGRVGLVIGDVAGHNIASASTMGQVRSLLRAYAIDDPGPSRALQRTNAAVARLLPEALASVVYAVLEPATGDLWYANAGHPPPIISTRAGQAEYLDDTAGTMLGASTTLSFTTGHRRLPPGARLLCYTDGLIEDRRRDIREGLSALAETLQRSRSGSAEQTCATVQAALVGTARQDDICLLVARLTGPLCARRKRAPEATPPPGRVVAGPAASCHLPFNIVVSPFPAGQGSGRPIEVAGSSARSSTAGSVTSASSTGRCPSTSS